MAIKFYGTIGSTSAFRALVGLVEKDIEFEFVPVSTATKEHKSPNFLALHPFGQVPAFQDGDLTLFEKDLDFELINVDLASGEHKMPHMLARNPFGQIPAFEDGDVKLFESRAISQYISTKYADRGTELINKDPKKAAVELVWIQVESLKFEPVMGALAWELRMKPLLLGTKGDKAIVKKEKKVLENLLDVYEERLRESKYFGGDSFSLADMYHIVLIKFLMDTEIREVFDTRPHVSAWVKGLFARPACVKVFGVLAY